MIAKKVRMRTQRKSSMTGLIGYLTDEQQLGDPEDLIGYMTHSQGKAERVGKVRITNCQAIDAAWAAAEIKAVQAMNKRARSDKTYHMIISFREGEQPESATLQAVENRLCDALGFGAHQRISVVHQDTDNLHIHVAINKIHPRTFTLHEPYYDHRTRSKVCAELEVEFNLQRDAHTAQQSTAMAQAADLTAHTGVENLLVWIKQQCQTELEQAKTWEAFHAILRANDLSLRPRGDGFVFVAGDGTHCKASSVSRALSMPALLARLGPRPEVGIPAPEVPLIRSYRRVANSARARSSAGYAVYLAEQAAIRARKTEARTIARAGRERRIAEARRQARLQRAAVKLMGKGLAATIAYQAIRARLRIEIRQAKDAYAETRKTIQAQYPLRSWADWQKRQERCRQGVVSRQRQEPGVVRSIRAGVQVPIRDLARDDEERSR